jgi:hypothetical protein
MWDRSTRRRPTKARTWQNGLDDRFKGLQTIPDYRIDFIVFSNCTEIIIPSESPA